MREISISIRGLIVLLACVFSVMLASQNSHAGDPWAMFGTIGDKLVTVDKDTAQVSVIGSTGYPRIYPMAYDSDNDVLYGITDTITNPLLITIDRETGAATPIGRIDFPEINVGIAEAMAYNPDDGKLYAAVGTWSPISRWLVTIDPATAVPTYISTIKGTGNGEADDMVFVDGTLYIVDVVGNIGLFYRLDPVTGWATYIGNTQHKNVNDMAVDPETGIVYAPAHVEFVLLSIALESGQATVIGTTHEPVDFNGQTLLGLEFAPPVMSALEVGVDIKPRSCPNPLNVASKGVLPVAITGTGDFDVATVDPGSIRLDGVAPVRTSFEDVTAPFSFSLGKESATDCATLPPDGLLDLALKFDRQELIGSVEASLGRELIDGETLVLHLEGNLKQEFGGGPVNGEDVILIRSKAKDKK